MARLGEAYVRVRADLRDYDADLDAALKRSTDKFEKTLNKSLGSKIGKNVADGMTSEIDGALKSSSKKMSDEFESAGQDAGRRGGAGIRKGLESSGIGAGILKGIGGLLTDGLSGLPPQFKIAFGIAAIAAAPVILSAVEGAVSAGVLAGVAGIGIALASEYEVVREGARTLTEQLRESLVGAAEPFVAPLLDSFGMIDTFFDDIQGRLNNIFRIASTFVEPLTRGVLGFFDLTTEGIEALTREGSGYIDALSDGMVFFGSAINEVLTEFSELGDEGSQALRDILFAGADIVVFLGDLIRLSTQAYNSFRDLSTGTEWWNTALKILLPGLALGEVIFKDIDRATADADKALESYDNTSQKFIDTEGRSIRVTNAQTKALKEQADAIQDLRDAQFDAIDSLVSYHQSLRDLSKTAKENKGAFGFQTEGGLETIEAYSRALKDAEKSAQDAFASGKANEEQAQELWRQRAAEARRAAIEAGVQKSAIDAIFGAISDVIALPPVEDKFANAAASAAAAIAGARQFAAELNRARFTPGSTMPPATGLSSTTSSSANSNYRQSQGLGGYVDGGLVSRQQVAWLAEGNRPEVVLPLTNPRRTRELAAKTGLMNILGGDGASITNVFIGNEQLDSRMFRVAKASSAAQARMLNNTPRMN